MSHHTIYEIAGSAITLSVSLWVAFGPLRHRLPKFLTRLAKYSVALKLLTLSGLCWWGFYANWHGHPRPRALEWTLSVLGVGLIGGAIYVLQLKTAPAATAKQLPAPNPGVHTLPHEPAQAAKST